MALMLILSSLFLFAALLATIWYKFFYCPKQILKRLVAQGAKNAAEFELDPYDDYTGIKKAIRENPDLRFTARAIPGKVYLSFLDPDLIKEIVTNHNYYEKLNKQSKVTTLLIGKSIILSDGISWKLHRSLLSEVFQYSFFNNMIPTIVQTTDQVLGFSQKKEIQVMLPNTIELITADVATSTFFGVQQAQIEVNGHKTFEELSEITEKIMKYAMSPLRFFPGIWALNFFKDYRNLKRRIKTLRRIFNDTIQRRIQEIQNKNVNKVSAPVVKETDVLEILLQQRLKHNNDPTKTLTDEEILDDFFVFNVAGKDTTSSLVSMALYCCEKHPKWGAQLKEEVEKTIMTPQEINLDLINSMSFMSAFLNEVLRVFPPASVFLPRKSTRDHYIGNLFIEKGTIFTVSLVGMHHNPKFFEEPEKFNPARWFKKDTRNEGWKTNPFSFLPFSGGSRNCIGKHFALIEAKVILSLILKHFDVKLDPNFRVQMSYIGIAYLPREPIPFTFSPKQQ